MNSFAEVPGDMVLPSFPFIELQKPITLLLLIKCISTFYLSSRGQELRPTLAFRLISYTLNTIIEKEFSAIEKQRRPERLDSG